MLLRDGETAILGGLIRDEERNTRVRLPGLGSIPAIGSLFTSYDDSGGRTDVLLTITPRVVRGWDTPAANSWEFYSGTENVYTTKPAFAKVDGVAQVRTMPDAPVAPAGGAAPEAAPPASTPSTTQASNAPTEPAKAAASPVPVLAFSDTGYEVASGQEVAIGLVGANLASVSNLNANVLYNAQVLSFVRGERGETGVETFNVQGGAAPGTIQVGVGFGSNSPPADNTPFARLVLSGVRPGISYLVYQTPEFKGSNGEPINAQLRAARIVVR
jgi:general secretion pathway protein D